MERKEFKDSDEKIGDHGQFMVVEETVITKGESFEDLTNIVITWGKLKLKVTESRTSLNKEYYYRGDENKTNRSSVNHCIMSEKDELNKYTEMSGNKNGVVTDDAMQNKARRSEIQSQTEKNIPISSFTDSNNMTKSAYVSNINENNRRNCENINNDDKIIKSNLLYIIDENYCSEDEASDEVWTNIPITKKQNNSNNRKSSVIIQELDDCDDLNIEERSVGDKSPIIEEMGEDDEENAKHVIIDSQIVIEEMHDLSEHKEVSTISDIQDKSEKKALKAKPETRQTIHLSFQRCLDLDYHNESVEENIPEIFKTEQIQSISDVIAKSRVVLLGKPEQEFDLKSTLNDELCPLPDSFEQVFEKLNIKSEEDAICCKREATPDLGGTTSRQEIYLFIFLIFLIFLLIFHFSTSSYQEYSCYGGNSEDETTSCALDGYVELSRI